MGMKLYGATMMEYLVIENKNEKEFEEIKSFVNLVSSFDFGNRKFILDETPEVIINDDEKQMCVSGKWENNNEKNNSL